MSLEGKSVDSSRIDTLKSGELLLVLVHEISKSADVNGSGGLPYDTVHTMYTQQYNMRHCTHCICVYATLDSSKYSRAGHEITESTGFCGIFATVVEHCTCCCINYVSTDHFSSL